MNDNPQDETQVAATPAQEKQPAAFATAMATLTAIGKSDPESVTPSVDNFSGDKMARLRMASKATGGTCKSIKDARNETITLRHFFCHRIELTEKNGEGTTLQPRTVLFSADGEAYEAVSRGIYDSLLTTLSVLGELDFPEDLKIKILETDTRQGNTILKFEVV